MKMTRRTFLGTSALALGGCATGGAGPRHVSDYAGVQVGVITYSYRSMPRDWRDVLKYVREDRLGTIELMGDDAETFINIPRNRPKDKKEWPAFSAQVEKMRLDADIAKFAEMRRIFADAGVDIHIVKFGGVGTGSDEINDYYFNVAKALGARAITREVPAPKDFDTIGPRCAKFADKHGVFVAFHNHTQINSTTYDGSLLGYSQNLRINFDIGHYVAASVGDPIDFVRKYHDRIFSIHLKDRTTKEHGQKNLAFGQGDTPLKPLFDVMKANGWDYPCDIELEYTIPQGSDACKEVGICNGYCERLIVG